MDNVHKFSCYYNIYYEADYASMAKVKVNIRMDEDLKNEFEELCNDLGLTMTSAITIFMKATLRCNGLPFKVALDGPHRD
jgi:DNA-damage-inducible protein J